MMKKKKKINKTEECPNFMHKLCYINYVCTGACSSKIYKEKH